MALSIYGRYDIIIKNIWEIRPIMIYNEQHKPSFIEGENIKPIYDLTYHYSTGDFSTLAKYVSDYIEHPVVEVKIYISDEKLWFSTAFGWENGTKHDMGRDYFDDNIISKEKAEQVAEFTASSIEEYESNILYEMIAEALGNHKAYAFIYNSQNDAERLMYEKYFGKRANRNAALTYKFNPDIRLLNDVEEIIEELQEIITPEVEIVLIPVDKDRYDVECYCGAAEVDYKVRYEEIGTNEFVPYSTLTVYLKNWVEELCNHFPWANIVNNIIEENKIDNLSYKMKEYLRKNVQEKQKWDFDF